MVGRAVEQRLNAGHSAADPRHARCRCGPFARYAGRREQTFASVLGPLRLERAYFHGAARGHGFCPRDRQLGLENTSLSPAVTRMVAAVGAMVSFEEGSQLLAELAGITVGAKLAAVCRSYCPPSATTLTDVKTLVSVFSTSTATATG